MSGPSSLPMSRTPELCTTTIPVSAPAICCTWRAASATRVKTFDRALASAFG
jgi:hypothetical protein